MRIFIDGMLNNLKKEIDAHEKFDPARTGSNNVVNGSINRAIKKTKSNSDK